MNIKISIFSLCKNNNGFFKSTKQSEFLIEQLTRGQGYFGRTDSGYHTCPLFAEWDEKGIIKTSKSTSNGMVTMFERKVEGVVSVLDKKEIKRINRRIKKLQKQLDERIVNFEDGSYDSEVIGTNYSDYTIELYWEYTNRLIKQIENLNSMKTKLED